MNPHLAQVSSMEDAWAQPASSNGLRGNGHHTVRIQQGADRATAALSSIVE
jgi:hypothetical protein